MQIKKLEAVRHVQPALPANYGHWSGIHGNSNWVYNLAAPRWDMATGAMNTWGAMIARTVVPNINSTTFGGGFPNFYPALVALTCQGYPDLDAEFTFPPGQQLSGNRAQNMNAADWWVANYFNCTVGSVTSLRSQERYTWHEMEDLHHIILVPWEIHGNVHHSGGIEVINAGGITSERRDFSGLESRRFGGELLFRLGHTWVARKGMRGAGTLREIELTYICDDPEGGPHELQQRAAAAMAERWESTTEQAWPLLCDYVAVMDCPEEQKESWQAAPEEVIVYPPDEKGDVEIGILYECNLEPGHGLGIRLRNGEIVRAGHGDAAL